VAGVVHVGANIGQERDIYRRLGLQVVWIEPIPEVFQRLTSNLKDYPEQRAFQYLITDLDDSEYSFHIANNEGASSSILDFAQHKDIWPEVAYERTINLRSMTLASFFRKEQIDAARYQALIMDTQGSELLVMKGADSILQGFSFIKTEVPDFESYRDCCQLRHIEAFLKPRGFKEFSRTKFAEREQGGAYYDVVYTRVS
jgi:FkbM family methyltransferase